MEQFLESLRRDGLRLADVVRNGPLVAEVRGCPGWTLADLARHMGYIHRWVVRAVETRSPPPAAEIAGPPGTSADVLGQWLEEGVLRLVRTLEAQDPDAPTWHPFAAPQVLAVWPRRQAHETLVHRWDAEDAVGAHTPIDPSIAADGILEFYEIIVPRVVSRDGKEAPVGVLRIECDDAGFVCTVSSAATVDVELGDGVTATPDAVIRGDASRVLLALWQRVPLDGDLAPLAQEWLAFGGN